MSQTFLVDDHLLLRVLLEDEPPDLRPDGAALATTGLWYHRLCRALSDRAVIGSMSKRLGNVDATLAANAIAAVVDLPDNIELISLRTLGWPMTEIVHAGARLNLLSLEAIAVAKRLQAEICLAEIDDNQPLCAAAERLGLTVRFIAG